ncbi:hypothetical protein ABL78_4790 [Leptomonas seymouri]|uniref:Uncharacterized protein n=1 Tax=Leptomonas seymouri TaxID=5684 RepID=A0A0N1PDX6_LEPSE|nr:hypothetical protein ABL78_4790 [Leptomonas seymouri]|eukprot:KPI86135.1 hypothetical protein ABL78_4790 [Leptomonas seymouri]
MSQPRDNSTNASAAPWLADNGLWSPSSRSSSLTALTPACPTSEGAAAMAASIEATTLQLASTVAHSRRADEDERTRESEERVGREGDVVVPALPRPPDEDDAPMRDTEVHDAGDDVRDSSAKCRAHDMQTPLPPLVVVPNISPPRDASVTAVVSVGAECLRVYAALDGTRASSTPDAEQPVYPSAEDNLERNPKAQLATAAQPKRKGNSADRSPTNSQQQQQQVAASPSLSQQEWIESASASLHDEEASDRDAEAQTAAHLGNVSSKLRCDPFSCGDAGLSTAASRSQEQQRQGQHAAQPPSSSTSRPASSGDAIDRCEWVSCNHSDPPARYRDTPAYYCTYCSYTVCEACYALTPAALQPAHQQQRGVDTTMTAPPRQQRHNTDADDEGQAAEQRADEGVAVGDTTPGSSVHRPPADMSWLDDVLASPSTAVRREDAASSRFKRSAAAALDVSIAGPAPPSRPHPRQSASVADARASAPPPSNANAQGRGNTIDRSAPPPCHLCRRGHLRREEALLHEWCCEGPTPQDRLHRGHTVVYDTQSLQKYHFMRAQRDARLASTAPLHAQLLSVSPLQQHNSENSSAPYALHQTRVRAGPSRRDPMPAPSVAAAVSTTGRGNAYLHRSTRRTAAAAVQAASLGVAAEADRCRSHARRHHRASSSLNCACEEGGSFIFSVRNPGLEVPLVWCAVNCQPREEAPAYARAAGMVTGHASISSGGVASPSTSMSSTVTPLLVWRCPPSLPGLPARPYRVIVPYGLYAMAHVHSLALYAANDIFRKAPMQLVDSAGSSGVMDGALRGADGRGGVTLHRLAGGSLQHLASISIAPAAVIRPLLTVTVLHHVATTPRPLVFTPRRLLSAAAQTSATGRASKRPRTPDTAGTEREGEAGEEGDAKRSMSETQLNWPDGLASPELTLCVDHLLHGRSVAVYGIASKFFFLQHVASSAELQTFRVVTVDASLGRVNAQHHLGVSSASSSHANGVGLDGGLRRGPPPGSGAVNSSSTTASSSVMRQLLAVGHTLVRGVSSPPTLTAVTRAGMAAAAAAARRATQDAEQVKGGANTEAGRVAHRTQPSFDGDSDAEEGVGSSRNTCGGAASQAAVARALLRGDEGRSPAVARDVTSAASAPVPHQQLSRYPVTAVDVVDVDSASTTTVSSCRSPSGDADEPRVERGSAAAVAERRTPTRGTVYEALPSALRTPPSATHGVSSLFGKRSPYAHLRFGSTPVSQRVPVDGDGGGSGRSAMTQLGLSSQASTSSLPAMSPIPAFFKALQRTVIGADSQSSGEPSEPSEPGSMSACLDEVTCEELPELFGEPNALRLPLLGRDKGCPAGKTASPAAAATAEMDWKPPVVAYASDAVRRHILQSLRRQHHGRRCVQWASLPSTCAAAQLDEQTRLSERENGFSSPPSLPSTLLTSAHQTRPGWQPPVLLVLHNVDLLHGDEANVLLQLCAQFSFPQPHLQLLLSFDDPLWPLGPVAAALERFGVCAVQLRSLLLPRVHEMQHVSSIHLLTELEAAAGGGRGGTKGVLGGPQPTGAGTAAAATTAAMAGSLHLLQDTMRRVLFSLPPAFNSLLRILLDVQDDVGEGVFISLFTVTERFEQSGVMVSQGRLKALLRELTSNRIARYDPAEHALMILQTSRLRKVLDEVTAQRAGGSAGGGGGGV